MASLRTAFIQSFNNINAFSIFEKPFQLFITYDATNEDQKKINNVERRINSNHQLNQFKFKKIYFPLVFGSNRHLTNQMNSNVKTLNRIGDMENFDFSECQDMVHVLELEEEDEFHI